MVVPQSAALESQDGATKESIVLSRIRMLDARLSNGDKSSPSAHTRKYVHPFNRAAKSSNHTSSNKIIANSSQPQAQHPTESRDTDSSSRPNQISHRETILSRPSPPKNDRSHPPIIDTDQEHLLHIRNSSPRGDRGSPLRRDDTVHTFQSSQVKPTVERNASPAKPIRYSPSPIPSRTINIQTSLITFIFLATLLGLFYPFRDFTRETNSQPDIQIHVWLNGMNNTELTAMPFLV